MRRAAASLWAVIDVGGVACYPASMQEARRYVHAAGGADSSCGLCGACMQGGGVCCLGNCCSRAQLKTLLL